MDGSPIRTQKSKLLQLIEKHSQKVADNIPMSAAVLIDAVTLLQSLQSPGETLGDLAGQVLEQIMWTLISPGSRVDFAIDQNISASVKKSERLHQASSGAIRVKILTSALCRSGCSEV